MFIPEIEQGEYKVLFAVDADSLISESDETNNIKVGDITLTNPDLLPLNLELSQDVVGIGGSLNVDFVISNQGDGDSDFTFYRVSLAGENLEQELFLGDGGVGALESSATSEQLRNQISIPLTLELGNYYVKVFADDGDNELETDETNNVDSVLLQVTNPDLTLTGIIASPNVISVGFPTTVELDVENIGQVDAPATSLSYVLSSDNVVDENDYFFGSTTVSPVDSLDETTVSVQLNIPSFINPGEYLIIAEVDPFGQIPELDEDNNQTSVNITVNVLDLEILNEGLDKSTVGTSELLEIEARVTNVSSNAKSPGSFLGIYLSVDTEKDFEDRLIGFIEVEELELGATSTNKVLEFVVPADIEAGSYNVLFSADDPAEVNESDETNNVASVAIEITNPDLEPSNLVLSKSSLELSETFAVTVQVTNTGDSKSAGGSVDYYLSTEETALNDSSIYLGERFFDELAVDEDTTLNETQVRIPSFLEPADYFLLAFVDSDSLIAEVDEGNNIIASSINLLFADLLTINEELDKESVTVGDTLEVSYNLKNDGEVASNPSFTTFFLAGADTTYLSNFNEPEESVVANGTASSKDIKLVIPFDVDPGEYTLGIEVDNFDNTVESDEKNNVFGLDVTILPIDLEAVSAFTIPAVIEPDSTNFSDQSFQVVDFTIEAKASVDPSLLLIDLRDALYVSNIFISEDEVYDESDIELVISRPADTRVLTFPSDSTYAIYGEANFPYNIPKGDYFALFQLDGDSLLSEEDEGNNFVTLPITYGNAIKPDLIAVEQQVIPSTLTVEKEVTVIHHVVNDGVTRVRMYDNGIYLSEDDMLDVTDVLLGQTEVFGTNPGLDQQVFYEVELTDLLPDGTSFIYGINDELDLINEQNEDNNAVVSEITFYQPLPIDFTPTCSNQLPEVILSGDAFDFAYEVENLGTGIPEDLGISVGDDFLTIEIYFSDDATLSAEDVLLAADYGAAVSQHEIVAKKRSLTIPSAVTPGTYYIIVRVDALEEYEESDESNNELALAINVQESIAPDLTINFNAVESSVEANNSFEANVEISNLGGSSLNDISVGFYIGETNNFSEDLRRLDVDNNQISVSAYQNGRSYSFFPSVPFDVEPGRYILFARVDDDGVTAESNEDNNVTSTSIEVLDAIIADFSITPSTEVLVTYEGEILGRNYAVSYTARNNGSKADFVDVGVYFSLDEVFDASDALLTETNDLFVSGFGNQRFNTDFFELPDLLAGDYTIFIVVDPLDDILEIDETDNIQPVALTVLPPSQSDVSPEGGLSVADSEIGLNGVIEITQEIDNLDRAPVDSVLMSFYISTDPTISDNDLLLTELYAFSVPGFSTSTVSFGEIIPASLATGNYYLICSLDENDLLEESNEANNEEFIAITLTDEVQPDLIPFIEGLGATSLSANTVLDIDYSVFNGGDGSALDYEVGFYLSRDDVIDGSDILLDTEVLGLLESGFSDFVSTFILIPAGTDPGNYNLAIVADPNSLLVEVDETNNTDFVAIEILAPEPPDLVSSITSIPDFINARESIEITHRAQNIGLGVADQSLVNVYLSVDDVLDTEDQLIGTGEIELLLSNETSFTQILLTIPNVAEGDYFVISVIDEAGLIEESDEENNQFSTTIEVGLPIFPDLTITSITLTDETVNAGNEVSISVRVANEGENQSDETTVDFYLSQDALIDASDALLGSELVPTIFAFSNTFINASYTIAANTTIGNYYILAEVNPNQIVEESDLENNVDSVEIEILERLLADLAVTSATVQPSGIPAGQEGSLSISIFNLGGGSASGFTTEVYLSTDETLDAADELLSTVNVEPILFGESAIVQSSFTIDVNTAIGTYYLLIDVDTDGQVEELDESNNGFSVEVDILESLKADLVPDLLTLDASSINAGGTIGVSFEVLNQGQITSLAGSVGVYFSADNELDAADELITSIATDPINAAGSDAFSASVPVPLEETPGDYFIIVNVDDEDVETELSEVNNSLAIEVEVTDPVPGNLTITEAIASATEVNAGGNVDISATISNTTTNAVLPFTAAVYLSENQTIESTDEQLASESFDILAGQGVVSATFSVALSSSLEEGDYFLIVRVDDGQVITETDETDNDAEIAIMVSEALSIADDLESTVLYPNPVLDILYLNLEHHHNIEHRISVVDLLGREVLKAHLLDGDKQIDVSQLDAGEYIIIIQGNDGEMRERFIKQ